MNVISLTMGDWSHDGHCMTSSVQVETNLTLDELGAAYAIGVAKTEVDLSEDVACDYDDAQVPDEVIEKLSRFGLKPEEFFERWDDDGPWSVSPDGFWLAWLFIAKVGNPALEFSEVERSRANVNIGGYGMFNR